MTKRLLSICLLFTLAWQVIGQPKHDYNWLLGYGPAPDPIIGGSWLNFHQNPVEVSFFDIQILYTAISMISDSSGSLQFYTNGCEVINAEHELMANGDSINAGDIHDWYCEGGYPGAESVMTLPQPSTNGIYYIFHQWANDSLFHAKLKYSVVDMSRQNGQGEVVEKNTTLLTDKFTAQVSAVRHGNGRDWWIIVPKLQSNAYYRYLLSPSGIHSFPSQAVGTAWSHRYWSGQAGFSPDGSKYVRMNPWNGLHIYDFDRCGGWLSNPLKIDFPNDTISSGGVSVSPNNRFLYVSASRKVYQFDLRANDIESSRVLVAEYDGFQSPFSTRFYQHMLAPDGKIYLTAPSSVNILHIIHHPNRKGLACELEQHGLILPTLHAFAVPNFPYFRLSALDGSPCDTLGIDMPVGVEEQAETNVAMAIFPNPAAERVRVVWYEPLEGRLVLADLHGRELLERPIGVGQREMELSVAGLPEAVYLLRIRTKEGDTVTKKLVISR